MKHLLFITAAFLICACSTKAQKTILDKSSTNFEAAMIENIKHLDTASTPSTLVTLANNFDRIGKVEKLRWEPTYYASYCYATLAFLSADKNKVDGLLDKSEYYLQQAEAISKNNSEISSLYAMINSCRIIVDPINRFQTKRKDVFALLAKANLENPENPRSFLVEANFLWRTPAVFGGGKKPSRQTIETAIEKYKTFKPENAISPTWGKFQALSLLRKIDAN
ncbi:MAG TPA: hypothetical protein VF622_08495 [Segetibacter sp.]|jgi:hypothetical protein